MQALRKHPSLVASAALPLALVAWFAATHAVPKLGTPAPSYDAVYMINYAGEGSNALHINVVSNKAVINFIGENFGYGWPRIYRYHTTTRSVEEIPVERPKQLGLRKPYNRPSVPLDEEPHTPVPIPALEVLKLDPSEVAPDGYVFSAGENISAAWSPWQSPQQSFAYLGKDAVTVVLPRPDVRGRPQPTFLGWVLP